MADMANARAKRGRRKFSAVLDEHRSRPLPRSARQAGERTVLLSGTANPHAVKASAIDLWCCRLRKPGHDRDDGAEGGTAHGCL